MNDLISRHGVSAWLDNMGHPKLADAILDEKRFQPADKPKGKWYTNRFRYDCTCSNCGCSVYHKDALNFCPNCGARMEVHNDTLDIYI